MTPNANESDSFYYDGTGSLVGHSKTSFGHTACEAFDASFVFPGTGPQSCTRTIAECIDAGVGP
jgi:hypothetical protein